MASIVSKVRAVGISEPLRLGLRRVCRYFFRPYWYVYKFMNRQFESVMSVSDRESTDQALQKKEQFLQSLLVQNMSKKFLEIGIGENPNIERIRLIKENNIGYTACDFAAVCDNHKAVLRLNGISTEDIKFAGNRVGSYSWTLFEMLSRNERFDIIYIDGHHTFYVDLPAFVLAHQLLEPGGYLLVDDVLWTLEFLRSTLLRSFHDWYFYRKIYDFDEYELEQQKMPHMKLIVEQILIKEWGYIKNDEYSIPEWWVLQKPAIK